MAEGKALIGIRLVLTLAGLSVLFLGAPSCGDRSVRKVAGTSSEIQADSVDETDTGEKSRTVYALMVSPKIPQPGQSFQILATGAKNIRKGRIEISGPSGSVKSGKNRNGDGLPFWRIDEFEAASEGTYQAHLVEKGQTVCSIEFTVSAGKPSVQSSGTIWKTGQGWSSETEALYSAWINALFYEADERSSWPALDQVMQNPKQNFLYNHLGYNEDDPNGKIRVIMEPDCADNPFYLRAYFAWKLGLPFGYHECDRGYLGKSPQTGNWVTNSSSSSKSHPVLAFNSFLRRVMDGVHSGTARTALNDESSDYYPVPLTRDALRPGVVFADPYGHTLILVRWVPQTGNKPGLLLSVDAQPDGTVAVKRFWKGNFLFTTTEVVGEPGFKAFRPIVMNGDQRRLMKNDEISALPGMVPFSMQQKGMTGDVFYQTMDRNINPKPLDPEEALLDLIQALHEQLMVRVNSVANGEAYMKSHPGEVIGMPGRPSGVFQAGGQWEDFSTPNRDLRLLIAMDAIQDFPDKIVRSPGDYKMPKLSSPDQVKRRLEDFLAKKISELSITYTRTNGTEQTITIEDLLTRKEAFEMAYNPNDCIEVRWGAAPKSEECSACRRHVPGWQLENMQKVRVWFQKRLHPPT
ncbi:MAG: hypothetical protein WC699_08325 [Bacteroidales bacterium]|jgi:hypothetical protein